MNCFYALSCFIVIWLRCPPASLSSGFTVLRLQPLKMAQGTLMATLMPYQVEAVDWCLDRESNGCILAYDMGLGKTVISCAVIATNPIKTLVMVPASLLEQWVAEIDRHTTGFNVVIHHGAQRNSIAAQKALRRADIIISTVAVVARDLHNGFDVPAGRWIVDEAHRLKNSDGVSYNRLMAEAHGIENKIFLTGTPVCNRSDDMISLICLTNRQPYNQPKSWKRISDTQKLARLNEILPEALLRRTKETTIPELLPPIETKSIPVKMQHSSEQHTLYGSFLDDEKILRRILRMRQSANNHSQLMAQIQKSTEVAVKIEALRDLLTTLPVGEKILVFSQFTSLLQHLNSLFPGNFFYHGGLNSVEKSIVIDAFKQAPAPNPAAAASPSDSTSPTPTASHCILFINLRAGGCGLNLTEANHVILMEPYWNESEQKQAIDRVYRIGQKRPVTVYRFYLRNSIESWLHALQKSKQRLVNYLIAPSEANTLESIDTHRTLTRQLFFRVAFKDITPDDTPQPHQPSDAYAGYADAMTTYMENEGIF